MPKLVLIDGHALAYRAYHALPPDLATSRGELTNAVYGFTSMLLNVLRDEKPDYIVVTFDVGRTFRHEEFPEYKANRLHMADDLARQIERIKDVVRAFNIPIVEAPGYEADDVIGTLALKASEDGLQTLIVTGDTDTFQLIGADVRVLTSKGRFAETMIYDQNEIRARYGLTPAQLIDFKALKGDPADNIPKVPGVGDKTAEQLLQQFNTVEGILEHLDEIKSPKLRAALAAHRDQILQNKRLVTIDSNVPIEVNWNDCRMQDYNPDRVAALFRELEFRSLMNRLPDRPGPELPGRPAQLSLFGEAEPALKEMEPVEKLGKYETVNTPARLARLAQQLAQASAIVVDVETTAVDPMLADLVGLALTATEGEGVYIPVGHRTDDRQLPLQAVIEQIGPVLRDPHIPKITHNGKYDLTVLLRHGFDMAGDMFDTMVAAWLLEPGRQSFKLKDLAWAKLAVDMTPITELIGTGKEQITMAQVPVAQVAPYAAADVDMTLRLARLQRTELETKGLAKLFHEVEMPLVQVLTEMEMTGVALDIAYLQQLSRELYERCNELERQIHDLAGYPFNINSTQQLGSLLFEQLKLPPVKRTKTGFSTDAGVLETLRGKHPIIDLLLEYRHLTKLKSTYIDALPQLVNRTTGRVHTSYNQTGAITGRLSSSSPNLQNIPIRTEEGRRIRRAFIAAPGYILVAADYSQVELRILAHIAKDEGLLAAFRRGEDIHASTASTIFGVPLHEVTPNQRRVAKSINFGLSYGMSSFGLAQRTGLSQSEADQFVKTYFASYPGVKIYMDRIRRQATKQGYVETILGRRRYFPELHSSGHLHEAARQSAEREAINMPIQGSAADIMKIAMIRLHRALAERKLGSRLILQVHDELVLEVPQAEKDTVIPIVREAMEGAFELAAPLKVDLKVGPNWEEMEAVNGF